MSQDFLKNILGGSQSLKDHREEMGGAGKGNGGDRTRGYCMYASLSATESFRALQCVLCPSKTP